ncbi:MAG: ATP-binding protein [Clostridia bacterium]|nr:ATP-binding protein [Clostridia bacterium]
MNRSIQKAISKMMAAQLLLAAGLLVAVFVSASGWMLTGALAVTAAMWMLSRRAAAGMVSSVLRAFENDSAQAAYEELVPAVRRIAEERSRFEAQNEALSRNMEAMRAALRNMKEGILLLDSRADVLFANESAMQIIGEPAPVGKNMLEITRETGIHQRVREALRGERTEWIDNAQGRTLQLFFSPTREEGAMILWLDVTHRTQAEQMRLAFTANVSHELKTPLTNIFGYAEMLKFGIARREDTLPFAQKITDEAGRLLALIDDLLLLSSLDEKTKRIEMSRFSLLPVVSVCVERLLPQAERLDVGISVDCPDSLAVHGNQRMLDELLHNLIENAIKYNRPSGSVRVICGEAEGGTLTISVRDTGIGIPAQHRERVFERFFRVDESRSRKTGGTGLGLSIVKHVAWLHRGRVELWSEEGAGTRVDVIFPNKPA